jgi:catechol 2,3-dioxygenase-like lactoylglutathione lyase family enzyme
MTTADLARSFRLYNEVCGFVDAGGRMMWGERSARILEFGDDMTGALWWLVGDQEFLNLEIFNFSDPPCQTLPSDWLPNFLGWVRWGFAVTDFDDVVWRLRRTEIELSDIVTVAGLKRVCFRDPFIGVVVEVMEEGPALDGSYRSRGSSTIPRIVYAALSVSDLAVARDFYVDRVGMQPVDVQLHTPEMEALWGLPDAEREVLVLEGCGTFLEVVQYLDPVGKRGASVRLNDQGIMNIAIGFRERAALDLAIQRAIAGGCTINAPLGSAEATATYLKDPLGNSLEMLCIPQNLDHLYGWVGRPPAFR